MSIISIIAAIDTNRALGKGNVIPWNIPEDLKHFKEVTKGHPVIMGRKTWDSLPKSFKPLPQRTNIIVTRSEMNVDGVYVTHSVEEALKQASQTPGNDEIFCIGGGSLYEQMLPLADRLYVTEVDTSVEDADVFFPKYAKEFTKIISEKKSSNETYSYTFRVLERG